MSETKHTQFTPGPWHYTDAGYAALSIYGSDNKGLWHNTRTKEETEANARLIAAAPDGYELALLILRTNDVPEGPVRQAARAFLYKVEGH